MDLTCLPPVDQKELAKTRLELKKGERGPRSVRGKILCFPQLCICVLKPCDLIPWKPFHCISFSSPPHPHPLAPSLKMEIAIAVKIIDKCTMPFLRINTYTIKSAVLGFFLNGFHWAQFIMAFIYDWYTYRTLVWVHFEIWWKTHSRAELINSRSLQVLFVSAT